MKSRFYGRKRARNLRTLRKTIIFAIIYVVLGLIVIVVVPTKRIENNSNRGDFMTDNEIIEIFESMVEFKINSRKEGLIKLHIGELDKLLLNEVLSLVKRQREEKKKMQEYIDCIKAENTRLHQNLQEAHIDIKEHLIKNDGLKKLLDDKCDSCVAKDRSNAMRELAKEIVNDILPKYLCEREAQGLQIGFAISEKVNELTRKEAMSC